MNYLQRIASRLTTATDMSTEYIQPTTGSHSPLAQFDQRPEILGFELIEPSLPITDVLRNARAREGVENVVPTTESPSAVPSPAHGEIQRIQRKSTEITPPSTVPGATVPGLAVSPSPSPAHGEIQCKSTAVTPPPTVPRLAASPPPDSIGESEAFHISAVSEEPPVADTRKAEVPVQTKEQRRVLIKNNDLSEPPTVFSIQPTAHDYTATAISEADEKSTQTQPEDMTQAGAQEAGSDQEAVQPAKEPMQFEFEHRPLSVFQPPGQDRSVPRLVIEHIHVELVAPAEAKPVQEKNNHQILTAETASVIGPLQAAIKQHRISSLRYR